MKYIPAGPPRMKHQKRGLKALIDFKGVGGLLFDPGCIYGDAEITVNRGGKGFRITLRDLVKMQNGGRRSGHEWDLSIPTLVQRRADDGTVRLATLTNAWSSGVKTTYTVTTDSGRTIRATDEHPFYTSEGWMRLDQLREGTEVFVRGVQKAGGRQIKQRYRERAGLRHHPHATGPNRANSPYRVPEHRLVVEARMNGLELPVYLNRLRTGKIDGLDFLSPETHVHHKDFDPVNNHPDNLRVMSEVDHHRLHSDAGKTTHVLYKTVTEKVVSVEKYGEEETFDIEVEDDPHNFLANGFVVHNTGKTAVALDFLSVLALSKKREIRVLVTCPLAATDTWVIQSPVYLSKQVAFWSEVVGGSIKQKAETLISRGPQGLKKNSKKFHPRAHGVQRSYAWDADNRNGTPVNPNDGPSALGEDRPSVVIEIVNLDTFSSRARVGSKTMADVLLDAVEKFQPDVCIIDESHKIKSTSSNVSRLMGRIGQKVPRRIILTGTVMPHSPMDVFGQWRFLNPTAFGDLQPDGTRSRATFGQFQHRFAVMGGYMGRQEISFKNLDELHQVMAKNSVVAKKEDVMADLPPAQDTIVDVHMTTAERKAYDQMKSDLQAKFGEGHETTVENRLTQMLRLRQITSGYLPNDDTGELVSLGGSKVKTIKSLVEDTLAGEKRIVIFCQFTREIKDLEETLSKDKKTTVRVISGATPSEDRIKYRKEFGSDSNKRIVLVAQIKTLSLAVNELVTASHAIFGSLSQQRDDIVQARDRLNRKGQTLPTTFWFMLARGTVDHVIYNSYKQRTNLEQEILKHISGKSTAPLEEGF